MRATSPERAPRRAPVIAITAALIVTAGWSAGAGGTGGTRHTSSLSFAPPAVLAVLAGVAAAGLIALAGMGRPGLRLRREPEAEDAERPPERLRRAAALATLALVLVIALAVALLAGRALSGPGSPTAARRAPSAGSRHHLSGIPTWLVIAVAVGAAALALAVTLSRRGRTAAGRRATGATSAPGPEDPAASDVPADPRSAVLHAYRAMERELGRRGVARRPAEAPREYLLRAHRAAPEAAAAVSRLTDLFEQARFDAVAVTAADRDEALRALRLVVER